MKNLAALAFCLAMALLDSVTQVSADSIPGLYGTGLLNDRSLAPGGGADLHYSLISTPAGTPGTAFVTTSIPGAWVAQGPNSKWISASANGNLWTYPIGLWVYRTAFDLTGFDPASASINGKCGADDEVYVLLNGTKVADIVAFTTLQRISITNGFRTGLNTLDFVVTNSVVQTPMGLRVDDLQGVAVQQNKLNISFTAPNLEFCWATRTGSVYQVQCRSDLLTSQWIDFGGSFTGTGGTICTNDVVSKFQRFYRLVVTP